MTETQRQRKGYLELRVVLDTSVIFTHAHDLNVLSYEVSKLIKDSADKSNLSIQWYMPEVVVRERHYQILNEVRQFLPYAKKLTKFMGREQIVDDQEIVAKINDLIEQSLTQNGVEKIGFDPSKVDLHQMMLDAVNRDPPFDPGDHEKGFRDALVVECYMQLLEKSPADPSLCRVVLATSDGLMRKAVSNRINERGNAHSPCDVEEIGGLINILNSKANELHILHIQELAKDFFFRETDTESLFYIQHLQGRIQLDFREVLQMIPPGAEIRRDDPWKVISPRYIRQDGRRITWISQLRIETRAYKKASMPTPPPTTSGSLPTGTVPTTGSPLQGVIIPTSGSYGAIPPYIGGSNFPSALVPTGQSIPPYQGGSMSYYPPTYFLVATGQIVFEVEWSADVTDSDQFVDPRIDAVRLSQVEWH